MTSGGGRAGRGKKISAQTNTGQQGVNLIEQIVLRMGSAWHPTNASLDAGIDGEIELVDPVSHEASNSIIRVQSKATVRPFPKETDTSFEWPCDERDLEYWLSGNAPVVLVVSRPHLNEAYWVWVNDYFRTPARRKTARVQFDKRKMRLTPESLRDLAAIAIPRDQGIYFAPPPREEKLFSNLLRVAEYPDRLWVAETDLRRRGDIYARLKAAGVHTTEFVLRDRRILTVHDLTQLPWSGLVDRGTVEDIATTHWADSEDRDLLDRFTELLMRCVGARCQQIGCAHREERDGDLYFFRAADDLSARIVQYRSVKEETKRAVFQPYFYKTGERIGEVSYYRHSAFYARLRRYAREWFLEIEPTYFFSSDGWHRHPFYESKLKGIKALEKNATVLGQVVMWASLLRGREEGDERFAAPSDYPFLQFGSLATFDLGVGIDDESWLPNEEGEVAMSVRDTAGDLPLFEELDPYAPENGIEDGEEVA